MPESGILKLAVEMGCNPQEILDDWPEYWVSRLLIFTNPKGYTR